MDPVELGARKSKDSAEGRTPGDPLAKLLGRSARITAVREQLLRLLSRRCDGRRLAPILLEGETGTGKGLVAGVIHSAGPRRCGPFVEINCAAIPETLLEAELFGFERGAFTDARQSKQGLFQAANHGTLFLDEVGLLPERLQAKLLNVIEEREVRRLGTTRSEPVDVWILAATNEDLTAAVHARRFREDLYHRLAVLTLRLPPLRERGDDLLLLADHFLARACADYEMSPKSLAPDARAALLAYHWPGNIRELANVIERVVLLSDAPVVTAKMLDLPAGLTRATACEATERQETMTGGDESERLLRTLSETAWNISRAAAKLGITRNTLRYRIEKYGLRPTTSWAHAATPGAIDAAAPTPASASGPGEWKRRRIALLRAVLVTGGEEPGLIERSRLLRVLAEKVESFGGRVEESERTGMVAAFGLEPVEDAPRRAVLAALAIQNAAERDARSGGGAEFGVKVGIHIVPVQLRRASGGVEIDPEGRRSAWAALETLVVGEPGRILVEAAGGPPPGLPPLSGLDAELAPHSLRG